MFPKILKGVRVMDLSRLLPGPFASELLEKMGAEVTCIIPPDGDPLLGAYSPFESLKDGKKFLTVDLKSKAGLAKAQEVLSQSQILLEGFRPGTMDRLGLGFDVAKKIQANILYVSIVGYAEDDERFLRGAHDINFLVDSGVYSLLMPDDSALIPALQLADVLGGFYAAFQILMEWIRRAQSLEPRHLRVSVVEALEVMSSYLRDERTENLLPFLTGGLARYRIYWTQDKKRIAVAGIEPKFFQRLLDALEIKMEDDESEEALAAKIQKHFAGEELAYWKVKLQDLDACLSFIPSRAEILKRP